MNHPHSASQNPEVKPQAIVQNAVILSNVIELATGIVLNMGGEDTAAAVNRDGMSRAVLANIVANRIKDQHLVK